MNIQCWHMEIPLMYAQGAEGQRNGLWKREEKNPTSDTAPGTKDEADSRFPASVELTFK